jgi:hypothetical protein
MQGLSHKEKELLMKIETDGLSTTQVRLVKNIHALLANVLAADEESDFFEMSAELMKKTAELVKHANFAVQNKNMSYGDQAVEFAVDSLSEAMEENQINNFDN